MIRIGRILHPTDFSGNAAEALKYALAFASEYNAQLYLISVVNKSVLQSDDLLIGTVAYDELESLGLKNARSRLDEVLLEIRSAAPHLKVSSEIVVGTPFVEILRFARQEKIDLIVVGTHGRSSLAHLLIGSTAEKIVRHSPCPVLTIRQKGRIFVQP